MGERTKKSIFNISSNFVVLMTQTVLSFITRTFFIKYLGEEALGLNGLFTNILSMLSLADLGISAAINFSLYKPLVKNDTDEISSLMSFYRRTYKYIGIIISIIGVCLIPFLKFFIKDINQIPNVYPIYLLYLFNSVCSYFISYKETLIIADQKKYKLTFIEVSSLLLMNCLQIIFLLITKNFIIYLLIQIFISFLQRIISNIYITKKYQNVIFYSKKKITSKNKDEIFKNVKALFFHKIGDYCLNGTDNLIISAYINLSTVGLYSNYLVITTILNNFIYTIYNGLTASVGNLMVSANSDEKESVFKKIHFIGFVLYGFISICFINVFNDFISFWIGPKYCLDFSVVIAISINFYLTGLRTPCHVFKSASGLFDVDKYTSLTQAILNLIISILLVKKIGLLGVVLGTIISGVILPNWQRPYLLYKHIFKKSSVNYFKIYFNNILFILVISIITLFVNSYIIFSNSIIMFLVKGTICALIYIFILLVIYGKSEEFIYYKDTILKNRKQK